MSSFRRATTTTRWRAALRATWAMRARARCTRVDDVREEDDEGAAPLTRGEEAKRRCVIRLGECRTHGDQRIAYGAESGRPALRRHEGAHLVVEDERADAIAGGCRDVSENQRRGERMLETRVRARQLRHRATGVDETEDALRLLDRELARDRLAAARRRLPVDMAW